MGKLFQVALIPMSHIFLFFFLLQILLNVLCDEDKKFILRVISSTGTNLYVNHEKASGIVGSIGEGSVIGAYEKHIHEDGSVAYRVGNQEGWVIEGVELVSDSSDEEVIDTESNSEAEIKAMGEVAEEVEIKEDNTNNINLDNEVETKIVEKDEVATEMKKKNFFVALCCKIKKLVTLFFGKMFRKK